MALEIRPISLRDANIYVDQHHRHNSIATGNKFSLACYDGERLCGVAICGRPLSRMLDDGMTLEILRNCTDGTRNACSKLYGACVKTAKAMGYKKVITYTLQTENGASLKASNFSVDCTDAGGSSWNKPCRPREVVLVTLFGEERKYTEENKVRWVMKLK